MIPGQCVLRHTQPGGLLVAPCPQGRRAKPEPTGAAKSQLAGPAQASIAAKHMSSKSKPIAELPHAHGALINQATRQLMPEPQGGVSDSRLEICRSILPTLVKIIPGDASHA
jgi:hypothetical protein